MLIFSLASEVVGNFVIFLYLKASMLPGFNAATWGQCYETLPRYITMVLLTPLFLGLKYSGNLLPFHSDFQGNIAL